VTSSNRAITDPCIVFAVRRESMYFRRAYPQRRRFPGAPCLARFGGSAEQTVLMLETGVGAAAMESAVRWCLSEPRLGEAAYRPRLLLSLGFSGALRPDLCVGSLVLATEIVDCEGNCWPALHPTNIAVHKIALGRLLTMPDLIGEPMQKLRLGRQYEALAVDMESSVTARLCHERNIPFACVRAVSDDCDTALSPHLVAILQRGRVSPMRLAALVVRHPSVLVELERLARHTRTAAKNLLAARTLLSALDR
jgi:adenosylhomocysteine nucleosidase